MTMQAPISIAPGHVLPPRYITRHVGIFGATGTGKTSTAATLARGLACPVLILDAKGDLGGLGRPLVPWRHAQLSVSLMGADALARALDLSEAQAGALHIALAWASDRGWPLHTLADLRGALNGVLTAPDVGAAYGLVSPQSVRAVQRSILRLERGSPWAFGPRVMDPAKGQGVAVLQASDLAAVPGLYGAFVADLLGRTFDRLGEVGDRGAAGLVIMIDESHLVFSGCPPALVQRIESVVRLIRSKGVGLVFISQSPADLPDSILAQLGSRIQHGLRAATPRQQAAARAAAETMPGNVTAADVLGLGTGEALLSLPDDRGVPKPAAVARVHFSDLAPVEVEAPPVHFSDAPPPPDLAQVEAVEVAKLAPRWAWPSGWQVIGGAAGFYGLALALALAR